MTKILEDELPALVGASGGARAVHLCTAGGEPVVVGSGHPPIGAAGPSSKPDPHVGWMYLYPGNVTHERMTARRNLTGFGEWPFDPSRYNDRLSAGTGAGGLVTLDVSLSVGHYDTMPAGPARSALDAAAAMVETILGGYDEDILLRPPASLVAMTPAALAEPGPMRWGPGPAQCPFFASPSGVGGSGVLALSTALSVDAVAPYGVSSDDPWRMNLSVVAADRARLSALLFPLAWRAGMSVRIRNRIRVMISNSVGQSDASFSGDIPTLSSLDMHILSGAGEWTGGLAAFGQYASHRSLSVPLETPLRLPLDAYGETEISSDIVMDIPVPTSRQIIFSLSLPEDFVGTFRNAAIRGYVPTSPDRVAIGNLSLVIYITSILSIDEGAVTPLFS